VITTAIGGSISQRKQIHKYIPGADISKVGFYYEQDDVEVKPGSDLVLFLHNGLPPFLCDYQRRPKTILKNIIRNRLIVQGRGHIKLDFEFGMGDQVMQLEVYKKFIKEMPDIEVVAGIDPVYKNIYPYLFPKPTLAPWGMLPEYKGFYRFEMNHNHCLWDPRGGLYGKACLFGSEIGLDEVHENIDFIMSPEDIYSWALAGGIDLKKIKPPILGIHIHCNSRVTSNWPLHHAISLAQIWHTETQGDVVLIGDPQKFLFCAPWVHYQTFPCDWASTGAIIQALNLFVAVDSGPMHLGRACKANQIMIWGGSGPRDILGRPPQWNDALGKVDCVDSICCSCPKGNPICINNTSAQDIWKIITSGGFEKWKPNPYLI
jgi:hypothetical protein